MIHLRTLPHRLLLLSISLLPFLSAEIPGSARKEPKIHLTTSNNDRCVVNPTNPPDCKMDLMFPDACKDPRNVSATIYTVHLYALNIAFKRQGGSNTSLDTTSAFSEGSNGSVKNIITTDDYCRYEEIPKFPKYCISNREQVLFREHVKCLDYDTFSMDRNYNFTTGLLITCTAPYPLDVNFDHRVPYDAISTSFSKIALLKEQENLYRIQLQIPGDIHQGSVKSAHEYSGNYTFHSIENPDLKRTLSITILRKDIPLDASASESQEAFLIIAEGRIRCGFKDGKAPTHLVVVQAANPTEIRLLTPCLDMDKSCSRKLIGDNCDNRGASCQETKPKMQHGIIRCTCGEKTIQREFFMGLDLRTYSTFDEILGEQEKVKHNSLLFLQKDGKPYTDLLDNPELEVDVYDGGKFMFLCYFLDFFLVPPIKWTVTYLNRNDTEFEVASVSDDFHYEDIDTERGYPFGVRAAKFELNATRNMTSISCQASLWNSSDSIKTSMKLNVKASAKPKAGGKHRPGERKAIEVKFGQAFRINCAWEHVLPLPKYSWEFQGAQNEEPKMLLPESDSCLEATRNDTAATSSLSVCSAAPGRNGTYICFASNALGTDSQAFDIRIQEDVLSVGAGLGLSLGISVAIIVILLIVILIAFRKYRAQKARLTVLEIMAFEKGNPAELSKLKMTHEIAQYLPYDKSYEIPWKNFACEDEELGSGAYGIVMKGRIGDVAVAAKTVRPDVEKCLVLALLSEIKIMIYLGKHQNVVEFIGACTEFLQQGKPYLFVEFCSMGCLSTVLQKSRRTFIDEIPKQAERKESMPKTSAYIQLEDLSTVTQAGSKGRIPLYENLRNISTSDLIKWAFQITNAMEYLESKKVIHGDLAVRNVLLNSSMEVKITDFGLSRVTNYQDVYIKKKEALLPWRWLAIESLRDMVFTSKSDVWSFGVTLWEMFTLAELPYPGTTWSIDFLEELERGYRLRKPKFATATIYNKMLDCWKERPEQRPSFTDLKAFFAQAKPTDDAEREKQLTDEAEEEDRAGVNYVYTEVLHAPLL